MGFAGTESKSNVKLIRGGGEQTVCKSYLL